jgi:MoxR-like ATPase
MPETSWFDWPEHLEGPGDTSTEVQGRVDGVRLASDQMAYDTQTLTAPHHRVDELLATAQAEAAKAVVGCDKPVELMLIAAMAGGHVLLEGPPGTAKTLLSHAMARVLGVNFRRVQFTPDTTPNEIIGRTVVKGGETVLERGAVFTNVLLADEINRTPPLTQAALLEAMQERRVSAGGRVYWLEMPFFVIATQNPFEQEGVFALPESQLDRFMFKVDIDYPSHADELRMLGFRHQGVTADVIGEVTPLLGDKRYLSVQAEIDATTVPHEVASFLLAVVRATRTFAGVRLGASPRAAVHLQSAAKAGARLDGRDTVTIQDVASMAPHVLGHRLILDGPTGDEIIAEALAAAGSA